LAIVNSCHWKEALRGCNKNGLTPMRLLIQYLPGTYYVPYALAEHLVSTYVLDAAEVVLYRCIKEKQNDQGEVYEIEMSFEFLDDFQDLPDGVGRLHGLFNTLHESSNNEHGFFELQSQNTLPKAEDGNAETVNTTVKLPNKFNKHNHVLQWMVS